MHFLRIRGEKSRTTWCWLNPCAPCSRLVPRLIGKKQANTTWERPTQGISASFEPELIPAQATRDLDVVRPARLTTRILVKDMFEWPKDAWNMLKNTLMLENNAIVEWYSVIFCCKNTSHGFLQVWDLGGLDRCTANGERNSQLGWCLLCTRPVQNIFVPSWRRAPRSSRIAAATMIHGGEGHTYGLLSNDAGRCDFPASCWNNQSGIFPPDQLVNGGSPRWQNIIAIWICEWTRPRLIVFAAGLLAERSSAHQTVGTRCQADACCN